MQEHPLASLGGALAGGLAPLGAAARGGAALAGQAVGKLGVGQLGQAATGVGGAFVAGEAAQAPIAFNQAIAAGASPQEAARAAKEAALAYPLIADKLVNGEELNQQDYMDIAFLIPEALGAYGDIKTVVTHPASQRQIANRLRQQAALAEAMEVDEAARDALSPTSGSFMEQEDGVQSTLTIADEPTSYPQDLHTTVENAPPPLQRLSREGIEDRDITRRAIEQGIMRPGSDDPTVRATPEEGEVEGAAEGAFQEARRSIERQQKQDADAKDMGAEQQVKIDEAMASRTPEERQAALESARQEYPHLVPAIEQAIAKADEAGRFQETPGTKLDLETEAPEYAQAVRARKHEPGSIVHMTSVDA